ncbi:MAG: hypothetical protein M3020_22890 [Myxococcota bacterium]|nr:hypothetical protein [Myxococcota bacterium]
MFGYGSRCACFVLFLATFGCGEANDGASDGSGAAPSSAGTGGAGSPSGGLNAGGVKSSTTPVIPVEPGGPPPECLREVTLTGVTLLEPPPFDLVIVADHSGSLAWSREELAEGLTNLLDNVRGRSVRISLLTPTQYGASSALAQMPLSGDDLVLWKDPATGLAYENAVTEFTRTCTDFDGAPMPCPDALSSTPVKIRGEWSFRMPQPIAMLTPELDETAFAAQQAQVSNAILGLGANGSSVEQPLCTLSRYVTQDQASLPSHAVFLVISDEDDTSLPRECLAGYDAEVRDTAPSFTPCSGEACDAYRYSMAGRIQFQQLAMRCAAFDDLGNPIPGTEQPIGLSDGSSAGCDAMGEGPCTTEEFTKAAPFCDSGLELVGCDRQCIDTELACSLDRPSRDIDVCTSSFEDNGTTYRDLADYCARVWKVTSGTCSVSGVNIAPSQNVTGGLTPRPLVYGDDVTALSKYIHSNATEKFGAGNYLAEAIVFDPAFSCPINAGQSYAKNLVDFVGDRSKVFPLCESYAPALNGIWGFAQSLITTSYPLKIKSDEHVTAVVIIGKDGAERTLDASQYEHDEDTGILEINRDAIRGTDTTLRVEITSECRKIIE